MLNKVASASAPSLSLLSGRMRVSSNPGDTIERRSNQEINQIIQENQGGELTNTTQCFIRATVECKRG